MYTSKQSRGKVPDYPRPIPHIDVDEIPICDDTVVYEHWSKEVEQQAEERAQKRRKTRKDIAESYLRGGEIKILTASLKGPFEGWKNPWARQTQRKQNKTRPEVRETTVRRTRAPQSSSILDGLPKGFGREEIVVSNDNAILTNAAPPNPFNAKPPIIKTVIGEPEPSSIKRVEDWLRIGDRSSRRPISHVGSSPTPLSRQASRHQTSPRPRSDPSRGTIANQEPTDAQEQHALKAAQDAPSSRPGTASSAPTHESPRRAEAAILDHKTCSLNQIAPSTNLPTFEYRRGWQNGKHGAEKQKFSISATCKELQAPQTASTEGPELRSKPGAGAGSEPVQHDKPTSRPTLSAETSRASTVQNLPSAQIAPAARLEPGISNAHSTEELLQELPSTTRSELQKEQSGCAQQNRAVLTTKTKAPSGVKIDERDQECLEKIDMTSALPVNVQDQTPVREPETQEVIAAINPFEFSTVKKPKQTLSKTQTPATAQTAPLGNMKKRASLAVDQPASDDSQTLIKTGLKITKATISVTLEKPSMKISLLAETNTHSHRTDAGVHSQTRDGSLPSISSMFGTKKGSGSKSILKSSNVMSSAPIPSAGTTSTSTKQDAQIPTGKPGQNALQYDLMNEDEYFDVDAVIDELGSYLGTWDPEDEAAKMGVAN